MQFVVYTPIYFQSVYVPLKLSLFQWEEKILIFGNKKSQFKNDNQFLYRFNNDEFFLKLGFKLKSDVIYSNLYLNCGLKLWNRTKLI